MKISYDEAFDFLVWQFLNSPSRAEFIGKLMFVYKDRYGLTLPTLKEALIEAANKYASDNVTKLLEVVK